ncbi:MAG: UDP-N-acetylmuramoyl-L-alanine--D-glutamate ligase [Tenuifilaceae bacterium]|jgi:UDP-N-acetylmuramoylalanine--D-glutamate ligase|uniref:UDP-N-acetylmuramoyl-L-alanine--D-glutamate ligase n=1 Tax=Perlabentimonas gracilis TaxID=2715279 RepID=UPI001409B459|nr:UDP-N-acetylmuramoyl-L-alanine--D-glutamate ligase [Perlabentimonas gracilis]MDX9769153.1 UDP-N-acetylmuramoyl-L-alanine--D-glutamate ligase [Tenuifilaceae bacterium]NHB68344.1 UDP-N-acetylmuramoyl-L-alanine--D-glutamate ligase [Perlabentimonas gracilis]
MQKGDVKKRIVVLGGGESGVGAAVLAVKQGFEVFLSDSGKIKPRYKELLNKYKVPWEEENHTTEIILNAKEVIKSPGIPERVPIVQEIAKKGIPIISEIEFAGRYTNAKKICITGSNGKTTTTTLIYHMLKMAGLNVGLAGNVGQSFALQVAEQDYDYYVIELSSFQLDGMYSFKADIAILLNISPDHLDRYDYKMENYVKSKFRITQNLSEDECFIFCSDNDVTTEHLKEIVVKAEMLPFSQEKTEDQTAYLIDQLMHINYQNSDFDVSIDELSLKGRHNVYNSMAAGITGHVLNIRKDIIRESLRSFEGVEHRLEPVFKVRGVQYINDSKATNVNSAWYALECMKSPVVWIAGGQDKGNDYSELFALVKEKVKAIVCLGADNTKLHQTFGEMVPVMVNANSASEAVLQAYKLSVPGDVVLLSPACASFDLFENYEDRGRQFKEAVKNL